MRCSSSVDLVGVAAKLSDCAILPVQAQLQRGSREGTSACRQLWSTVRRVDFRDCRASIRQQPGSERACNILAEVDHLNAHEGQALVHRHRDRLCSPGSRPEVCLLKKRGIRVYYTQISLQHGSSYIPPKTTTIPPVPQGQVMGRESSSRFFARRQHQRVSWRGHLGQHCRRCPNGGPFKNHIRPRAWATLKSFSAACVFDRKI